MGATTDIVVNGKPVQVASMPETPLLYVLRDELELGGTRFGCGLAQCGACTVMVDGTPMLSCDTPLWSVAGHAIITLEGLSNNGTQHPVQEALLAEQAGQCGYCLSGIVMRSVALLADTPDPTRAEIVAALDQHLCRCGVHLRIICAVERAARALREQANP